MVANPRIKQIKKELDAIYAKYGGGTPPGGPDYDRMEELWAEEDAIIQQEEEKEEEQEIEVPPVSPDPPSEEPPSPPESKGEMPSYKANDSEELAKLKSTPDNYPVDEFSRKETVVDKTKVPSFDPLKVLPSGLPDSLFIINDITLSDVPILAINFESRTDFLAAETIRTTAPVVSSKGTQDFTISVTMIFPPGESQSYKLHRLVSEIRHHPLVYIQNNKIRENLAIPPDENSIFILETATIRNESEAIGSIVLDLTLHYFNYKPFSKHFWYNTNVAWDSKSYFDRMPKEIQLGDFQGYEASSYSLEYEGENLAKNLRTGAIAISNTPNVPVAMPRASDSWMYYADYLSSIESSPKIPSLGSDYVGFKLKVFQYIKPPTDKERLGRGSAKDIFGPTEPYPSVKAVYDATQKPMFPSDTPTASESRATAESGSSSSGSSSSSGPYTGRTKISLPGGAAVELELWLPDGTPIEPNWNELAKFLSSNTRSSENKNWQLGSIYENKGVGFDHYLQKILFHVAKRYPNKTITVFKSFGNVVKVTKELQDTNSKYKKHRIGTVLYDIDQHVAGKAWDFKVQDVDPIDMFMDLCQLFPKGFIGSYGIGIELVPNNKTKEGLPGAGSTFVHLQVGRGDCIICDASGNKAPSKKCTRTNLGENVWKKYISAFAIRGLQRDSTAEEGYQAGDEAFAQNYKSQSGVFMPEEQSKKDTYDAPAKALTQEEVKRNTSTDFVTKQEYNEIKDARDPSARLAWIRQLRKQGLYPYSEDPKIRNVFYKEIEFNISSNPEDFKNQDSVHKFGKDIVCSGASVTFGHRIVPHKLLSQPTYTWQFMGAGNRAGSLVFTFNGTNGRQSADALKKLIYIARENARLFGSSIEEAGSVAINWENPLTRETNSILALGNLRNIVVTDIEETSSSDGADLHQLVISFVAQDFMKEKLDLKIVTSFETKKEVIKKLMTMLVAIDNKDESNDGKSKRFIFPSPEYLKERFREAQAEDRRFAMTGTYQQPFIVLSPEQVQEEWIEQQKHRGYPYELVNGTPKWLGEAILAAALATQAVQESAPETSLELLSEPGSWSSRYAEYNAGELVVGRKENNPTTQRIDYTLVQTTNSQGSGYTWRNNQPILLNKEKANSIHSVLYSRWLQKLGDIADQVMKNSMKPDFERYFQGIGGQIRDAITTQLGECYSDLMLPPIKGTQVVLSPEFYVYSDITEDPLLPGMSENFSMEQLLLQHINNEKLGMKYYLKDSLLGGSYVSKNMPKILESRRQYLEGLTGVDRQSGEEQWLSYSRAVIEGTSAWEPVFYRPYTETNKNVASWIDKVSKNTMPTVDSISSNSSSVSSRYLQQTIQLSNYISKPNDLTGNDFYHWRLPYNSNSDFWGEVESAIFEDATQKLPLHFGPNKEYRNVDYTISGIPATEKEKNPETSEFKKAEPKGKTINDLTKDIPQVEQKEISCNGNKILYVPYEMQHLLTEEEYLVLRGALNTCPDINKPIISYEEYKQKSNLETFDAAKLKQPTTQQLAVGSETMVGISNAEASAQVEANTSNNFADALGFIAPDLSTSSLGVAAQTVLSAGLIYAGVSALVTIPIIAPIPIVNILLTPALVTIGILGTALGTSIGTGALQKTFKAASDKYNGYDELNKLLSDGSLSHGLMANKFIDESKAMVTVAKTLSAASKASDLSIRRVYPTFKIYFIEDDEQQTDLIGGQIIRAFDDFYSYSSVQQIRIIKSHKVASDLAIVRITNLGGKIFRRKFGERDPDFIEKDPAQLRMEQERGINAEYSTGVFADTEKENPFERMILQDGVKIQIRLGYNSNPDALETVFLGAIVEISPEEDGKILELTCQGFGAELDNVELGPMENGPVYYSSQSALSAAIIQPSIVNFGRRSNFNRFTSAEIRESFYGGEGRGLLVSLTPVALFKMWGENGLYKNVFKYPFRNLPQDDNIYAPPPVSYAGTWETFWNNACTYRPIRQTAWEIFKEHELRHPGWVSLAVPYGHTPRMTMFFGAKGQHYWSQPPSQAELYLSQTAETELVRLAGDPKLKDNLTAVKQQLIDLSKKNPKLASFITKGITGVGAISDVSMEIGKQFGRYRPFRNYFQLNSKHHIIENSIRTNLDGVPNEITVLYFTDEGHALDPDADDLAENITSLNNSGKGVLSCKLDENIPEEFTRSITEEYPSCITVHMARRYIQGLFNRYLRDAYRGEIKILGNERIKPYDICFISDTSINMSGPIEVEQVEHIIDSDNGFVSIITPNLCVDINEYYSAQLSDLTGAALFYLWGDTIDDAASFAVTASPFFYLGVCAGVKFLKWTQEGVPVITTPLTLGGKPFMSAALGQNRTSLFTTLGGQWNQYWDDLKNAWDKTDSAEVLFDARLGFQEWMYSTIGLTDYNNPTEISGEE